MNDAEWGRVSRREKPQQKSPRQGHRMCWGWN